MYLSSTAKSRKTHGFPIHYLSVRDMRVSREATSSERRSMAEYIDITPTKTCLMRIKAHTTFFFQMPKRLLSYIKM